MEDSSVATGMPATAKDINHTQYMYSHIGILLPDSGTNMLQHQSYYKKHSSY